jgi:hypothetical protein
MDAAQLFLFDPIPAKAEKLGLLSIYKFSLVPTVCLHVLKKRTEALLAGIDKKTETTVKT